MLRYSKFGVNSGKCCYRSLCRPRMKNTTAVSSPEPNEQTASGFRGLIPSMEPYPTIDGYEPIIDEWKLSTELRAIAHIQLVLAHRYESVLVFECVAYGNSVNNELPENGIPYNCVTDYQHHFLLPVLRVSFSSSMSSIISTTVFMMSTRALHAIPKKEITHIHRLSILPPESPVHLSSFENEAVVDMVRTLLDIVFGRAFPEQCGRQDFN